MSIKENIIPVLAFKDNYIWLVLNEITRQAWAVDPGEAPPVITTLEQQGLQLTGLLITHHHYDHNGGIKELIDYAGPLQIVGSHLSRIDEITHPVKENDIIETPSFPLRVLEIPGHTLDHTAYFNEKIIFCGDTLFSAGCGRVFEGTPAQMYHSLNKILGLPGDLWIYCGHEYTLANLAFAKIVEPNNLDVLETLELAEESRVHNQPTLPSPLSKERKINPFLRCDQPTVHHAVEKYTKKTLKGPIEIFTHLREWKNHFR